MFKTVRHLLELIRFSHTLFALPFALLAAVMAWRVQHIDEVGRELVRDGIRAGQSADDASLDALLETIVDRAVAFYGGNPGPKWHGFAARWQEVLGILLCMVAARSFAMSFNRLADRRLDAENPRTASRHLPAEILSVGQVSLFATLSAVGFVASTLLFLPNRLPLVLSLPVLAFLAGYSYAKRFSALAHFWLGTALALSPVAAWIAIRGEIVLRDPADVLPAVVLGGAVLTWVAGFDMIYACQDYDADIQAKLHSVPVRFGIPGALRLAAFCHLLTIGFLTFLPVVYPLFGWIYWVGVAAVALLLVYEHLLVRSDDLSRVNAAFFNVNAIISLGLLAAGSLDLWVGHR